MEDSSQLSGNQALQLPAFGKLKALSLEMDKIREAEHRIIEAKTVNPSTYADLEHCFNASYRDLKRHLSSIGYHMLLTEKQLEIAKSDVLLDKYPEFLEKNGIKKTQDNADLRKAFLIKDQEYCDALDRLNQLKALESNFDGKLKVMENVTRYMRKKMDLILRSGLSGADYYVTSGKNK